MTFDVFSYCLVLFLDICSWFGVKRGYIFLMFLAKILDKHHVFQT